MGGNCFIPNIIPYNRVETEREMPKLEIGCNKLLVVVGQTISLCEVVQIYLLQYPSCNISNMAERQFRPQQTKDYMGH